MRASLLTCTTGFIPEPWGPSEDQEIPPIKCFLESHSRRWGAGPEASPSLPVSPIPHCAVPALAAQVGSNLMPETPRAMTSRNKTRGRDVLWQERVSSRQSLLGLGCQKESAIPREGHIRLIEPPISRGLLEGEPHTSNSLQASLTMPTHPSWGGEGAERGKRPWRGGSGRSWGLPRADGGQAAVQPPKPFVRPALLAPETSDRQVGLSGVTEDQRGHASRAPRPAVLP